ncbi:substrate-binding domain-containing protein [Novosphingobium sp. FSY-8]|uniref:Substrate-binding domain-containing protein n=1 Tax=Novosphingobium ovatum TaxID=1908523 RepID=A0ABW9X9K1_9SPHN|nr:LacI family DNA-binding transcriptional regulator [Novosphingobium ovatum]NBC35213.1 substrate-binding domain-containing protein [Novosphingobium ovatum]
MAKAAGVSVKTASRVLNNQQTVRSYLRARVEQAIADLNYAPSMAARQLASQRSYIIGLIVPRAGVGYLPRLISTLSVVCREMGFQLITEAVENGDKMDAFARKTHFAFRPDAIILSPRYADDPDLLTRFEAEGIPLVRLSGSDESYGTVLHIPDAPGAADMTRHLIGLGHRRIGLIAMPPVNRTARERYQGYIEALTEAGIAVDPDLVVYGDYSYQSGGEAITRLMALSERPTAVFATSDTMATGAQAQAQRLGFRVPEDVAIAGYDDSPVARACFPPITSISFPLTDIARAAAQLAITGECAPLPNRREVIARGSTTGDRQPSEDPYGF